MLDAYMLDVKPEMLKYNWRLKWKINIHYFFPSVAIDIFRFKIDKKNCLKNLFSSDAAVYN